MKKSQRQKIKEHLESGKSITPLEALKLFGCLRLSARIYELKQQGMNISRKLITSGDKKFAEYWLKE